MPTWIIVGASRGIGLEFVRQLLARGDRVIATLRNKARATQLVSLADNAPKGACHLLQCDLTSETSITNFVKEIPALVQGTIDYVVLNAGVLKYPNRATEISYGDFVYHLKTNTIGPIITAQKLLQTQIPIGTIVFMSSDSGSAQRIRLFEDGFAAYAASKCALNQMLRNMDSELKKKEVRTTILAMHPGEVETSIFNPNRDMGAEADINWEVEGVMQPEESVLAMLKVIPSKTIEQSGTFWTWEDKVTSYTSPFTYK
ncbi:MAG: hypothetical protein M1834_002953 [Cirrosporium novae-zelandiae]|nr:MAG: hypothetical protein M1834_002953 [Cirrosporium novae-zelandiae]